MAKDNNDKFTWQDGDVEILNSDGTPKKKTTAPEPEQTSAQGDKFSWGPGDVEILNPDGSKKR